MLHISYTCTYKCTVSILHISYMYIGVGSKSWLGGVNYFAVLSLVY